MTSSKPPIPSLPSLRWSRFFLFFLLGALPFLSAAQGQYSLERTTPLTPSRANYWDWQSLFSEPYHFERRSSIIQVGMGVVGTVDVAGRAAELDQVDVKTFLPALHLMYERQVWENVGVGLSVGTQMWKVPVFNYQYRYYTGGLHAAYHFNVLEKLDPYLALGATYRRMVLTNTDRRVANDQVTPHFLIGARYYFKPKMGAYLEWGRNTTAGLKFGLAFYLS